MGLEQVELVMCLEARFRIRIPDEVAAGCTTVGDLAAAVIGQLPRGGERTSVRRFYRVRGLLMRHAGAARADGRPGAELAAMIPREELCAVWDAMREEDSLVPPLQRIVVAGRLKWIAKRTIGFPAGVVTVADLVRASTLIRIPEREADRPAFEREVLDVVRGVISSEFGIPLEEVRGDSRLGRDLRMD